MLENRCIKLLFNIMLFSLLVLTAGCFTDPSQFNDNIAIRQRKIARAAQAFRQKTDELKNLNFQNTDMRSLGTLHSALVLAVADARTSLAKESVPGTAEAQQFYSLYAAYLEKVELLAKNQLAEISRIAVNPNLGKAEKNERINAIYRQVDKEEEAELKKVKEAQLAFAEVSELKLVFDSKKK